MSMIELLILYELNKKVLTMYGISKSILSEFAVLTTPSFGTIKPALDRLVKSGFVKSNKLMSDGGRPSVFYAITNEGQEEFKKLLLAEPLENPIQFLAASRVKVACCSVLDFEKQIQLFNLLKQKSENILYDIKNLSETNDLGFYQKMVFENLLCEYKNFISLLEGLLNACKNQFGK